MNSEGIRVRFVFHPWRRKFPAYTVILARRWLALLRVTHAPHNPDPLAIPRLCLKGVQ